MSQLEVPEEIEHLDFEPEKEEVKRHWTDPINNDIFWCGARKNYLPLPFSECMHYCLSKQSHLRKVLAVGSCSWASLVVGNA